MVGSNARATPTVSAIITGYNYARFLPGAIESVLAQTHLPDEIIVVDDGSTDETAEVVGRYAEWGVRYIYRPNGGASAARNTGIRASHGDLIAFLDADDRWLPEKTTLQLAHFARFPWLGIVTGSECQTYESGGKPFFLYRKPVGAASFYPVILVENTIGNPSLAIVKRHCFESVGLFDESIALGQDWEMWIRIARNFEVGVVGAVLILFTRHAKSLTSDMIEARAASNRQIQRRYIGQVRSPLKRIRLTAAARSMTLYYMAASIAEKPSSRRAALALTLASTLLDPSYEARNKAGLLLRAAFGRPAFDLAKRLLSRTEVVPSPTPGS